MLRKLNLVVRTRVRTHTTKTPNSVTDIFSSVVPNSGSTARDHLANERTFLAWARTGLTFVGLGVAIDSLLRVSAVADPTNVPTGDEKWKTHVPATGLVMTGGAVLTYSTFRYYRVQRCLMQGTFPLNRVGMGAVVMTTSILTLASLMMTFSDEVVDTSSFLPVPTINQNHLTTRPTLRTSVDVDESKS